MFVCLIIEFVNFLMLATREFKLYRTWSASIKLHLLPEQFDWVVCVVTKFWEYEDKNNRRREILVACPRVYMNYINMLGRFLEVLESVMCDVINILLKRRIATRSGKGNQQLNMKTSIERPILKLGLPNFRWSFYLLYFSLNPYFLDVFL